MEVHHRMQEFDIHFKNNNKVHDNVCFDHLPQTVMTISNTIYIQKLIGRQFVNNHVSVFNRLENAVRFQHI